MSFEENVTADEVKSAYTIQRENELSSYELSDSYAEYFHEETKWKDITDECKEYYQFFLRN